MYYSKMSFRKLLIVGQRPSALWLKRQLHDGKLPQIVQSSTKPAELIGTESPRKADYERKVRDTTKKKSPKLARQYWDSIVYHEDKKSEEDDSDIFNDRED